MSGIFFEKCIAYLIEKGLLFFVLWAFVCWRVAQSDVIMGLEFSDSDRGLILVLVTVIFVLAHYFTVYWRAKTKHYSPSSFSDETRSATIAARKLISSVEPRFKSGMYSEQELKQYMKDTLVETHEISASLQSEEVSNLFLRTMILTTTNVIGFKSDKNLSKIKSEFRVVTDWVSKK